MANLTDWRTKYLADKERWRQITKRKEDDIGKQIGDKDNNGEDTSTEHVLGEGNRQVSETEAFSHDNGGGDSGSTGKPRSAKKRSKST